MTKARISARWAAAPYQEEFAVVRDGCIDKLSEFYPPVRYATFEDARDNRNPIFAYELVEVPDDPSYYYCSKCDFESENDVAMVLQCPLCRSGLNVATVTERPHKIPQ